MLKYLSILNFALIKDLELEFTSKLNLITGETGAGKSILVDALGFVLGSKTDISVIRSGEDVCRVTGIFETNSTLFAKINSFLENKGIPPGESELLLKREISVQGKSRAWINGEQVPLGVLGAVGDLLVDFHGQHEHQMLLRVSSHLSLLDGFAGLESEVEDMAARYHQVQNLEERIKNINLSEKEKAQQKDLLEYQIRELENAKVQPGEMALLLEEKSLLASSEKRAAAANGAKDSMTGEETLPGAIESLGKVHRFVRDLAQLDQEMIPLFRRMDEALLEIKDLASHVANYCDGIVFDPERLELIEERLALLSKLGKKYGGDENAMLVFLDSARSRLDSLRNDSEEKDSLTGQLNLDRVELRRKAITVSETRMKVSENFNQAVNAELAQLGMEKAALKADIRQSENPDGWLQCNGKVYSCSANGIDRIEFMLVANPGEEARPLTKIVSGGELSRLMLAIKTILFDRDPLETLVFDEVDNGISGRVAQTVGEKLKNLAGTRQVLCITHLPQIACQPGSHFKVSKESHEGKTFTHVSLLDQNERVEEVASLLDGSSLSESGKFHARQLLAVAGMNGGRM